jgi:hypothetical protein
LREQYTKHQLGDKENFKSSRQKAVSVIRENNVSPIRKDNFQESIESDDDDYIDLINFSDNFKQLLPRLDGIAKEDRKMFTDAENEKLQTCVEMFEDYRETVA